MTKDKVSSDLKFLFAITSILILAGTACQAEEKKHGPEAIEIKIETGTKAGDLIFVPDKLSFERGKYYKLVVHNPSPDEHYFASDELGSHVFTRKVEVMEAGGKTIAEVHGNIYDIELKPGATVAWYFYPMTNGDHLKLYCHKEGHREKGMVGEFDISGPPPFTK